MGGLVGGWVDSQDWGASAPSWHGGEAPSWDGAAGWDAAPEPTAAASSWDAVPSSLAGVAPLTPPGGDEEEEEEAVRREIGQARQRIKKEQSKEVVAPWRRLKQEKVEEKPTVEALGPLRVAVLHQQAVPLDATR